MSVRCPKCGTTNPDDIWEDNFWSGCNRCGWAASCENDLVVVRESDGRRFNYPSMTARDDE